MKVALTIAGLFLALLIGFVWYMDITERQDSHFDTYQELQSSELIGKGWVPNIIPRSAHNIHEEHRVDVGRVHVWFQFTPGDTAEFDKSCTKHPGKNVANIAYKCRHGGSVIIVKLSEDGAAEIVSE